MNIAVIGAGGIACHLTPLLALDHNLIIVDGDTYEPGNSKRQFPALQSEASGKNKARYLVELLKERYLRDDAFLAIPEYLQGDSIMGDSDFRKAEIIISCVDNHQSRRLICDVAADMKVPAILCGNETEMGDAHFFKHGVYNPFDFHEFNESSVAPFACNSDDNPKAEQTSYANFWAAACGVLIMQSHLSVLDEKNTVAYAMLDVRGAPTRMRIRDFAATPPEKAALAEPVGV